MTNVLPFKIPKQKNEALLYQEDHAINFYDKLHQHQEIQISLILKGKGTIVLGDSISQFKPNDIFVIGSNIAHVFKSDTEENEAHTMLSLFFNMDSFGEDFFKLNELDTLSSFFEKSNFGIRISSEKEEAKKCFLKLKHATKLEKLILFFKILNIISHAHHEVLASFIYKKIYNDNEGERMSTIFTYSMKNFAQEIDLNQIAAIAFMTPNSFCRYFKQRTNITYFQFLIKIRIEHACTLLSSDSDFTVAEIAIKSGFKNISNFNRQFKSIKKLRPLEYKSIESV